MAFDESGAFRALELFADFNDEQMRLLSFASETVSLRMGEELFAAGTPANGAYVLVEGQLGVSGEGGEGFVVEPPAVVGEMGLMLARPRSRTVVARRASQLLLVPREPFLKILRSDAALAASVANTLRGELTNYLDRVTGLASRFSG